VPGGPVSSNNGDGAFPEFAMSANSSKYKLTSAKSALRIQLFAMVGTTARKILQQGWAPESFCFSGLEGCEWKGHSLFSGAFCAIATASTQ